jgi:hypothetical protein
MELKRLRRQVVERGGLCEAWLVYVEERNRGQRDALRASDQRPRLVRAFWTRVEAAEWALLVQPSNPGNRYGLYRVAIDERWVMENSLRPAYYVRELGDDSVRAEERPAVSVTAGAIAHAFG